METKKEIEINCEDELKNILIHLEQIKKGINYNKEFDFFICEPYTYYFIDNFIIQLKHHIDTIK